MKVDDNFEFKGSGICNLFVPYSVGEMIYFLFAIIREKLFV